MPGDASPAGPYACVRMRPRCRVAVAPHALADSWSPHARPHARRFDPGAPVASARPRDDSPGRQRCVSTGGRRAFICSIALTQPGWLCCPRARAPVAAAHLHDRSAAHQSREGGALRLCALLGTRAVRAAAVNTPPGGRRRGWGEGNRRTRPVRSGHIPSPRRTECHLVLITHPSSASVSFRPQRVLPLQALRRSRCPRFARCPAATMAPATKRTSRMTRLPGSRHCAYPRPAPRVLLLLPHPRKHPSGLPEAPPPQGPWRSRPPPPLPGLRPRSRSCRRHHRSVGAQGAERWGRGSGSERQNFRSPHASHTPAFPASRPLLGCSSSVRR